MDAIHPFRLSGPTLIFHSFTLRQKYISYLYFKVGSFQIRPNIYRQESCLEEKLMTMLISLVS